MGGTDQLGRWGVGLTTVVTCFVEQHHHSKMGSIVQLPIDFIEYVQSMKHLPRTGWLRTIKNPESVASHSFNLALLGGFAPVGFATYFNVNQQH